MPPVITLLTDFGQGDGYVAAMKGVILTLAPGATIVDISHDIPPQDIHAAAFTLAQAQRYFPPGTIHLVVVDPGVGTARLPLVVATAQAAFVAPDNGALSYVMECEPNGRVAAAPPQQDTGRLRRSHRAFVLDRSMWFLDPVSRTFHGRDVFAPVAARLAMGTVPELLGSPTTEVTVLKVPAPNREPGGAITGHIVHVDRFGNLITNIEAAGIDPRAVVAAGTSVIQGISNTYTDAPEALALALAGSSGRLEIAVRNGSAAERLGLRRWDRVRVSLP